MEENSWKIDVKTIAHSCTNDSKLIPGIFFENIRKKILGQRVGTKTNQYHITYINIIIFKLDVGTFANPCST